MDLQGTLHDVRDYLGLEGELEVRGFDNGREPGWPILWVKLSDGRHLVYAKDPSGNFHFYQGEFTARDRFVRSVIHTIPEGRVAEHAYSGRWLA